MLGSDTDHKAQQRQNKFSGLFIFLLTQPWFRLSKVYTKEIIQVELYSKVGLLRNKLYELLCSCRNAEIVVVVVVVVVIVTITVTALLFFLNFFSSFFKNNLSIFLCVCVCFSVCFLFLLFFLSFLLLLLSFFLSFFLSFTLLRSQTLQLNWKSNLARPDWLNSKSERLRFTTYVRTAVSDLPTSLLVPGDRLIRLHFWSNLLKHIQPF